MKIALILFVILSSSIHSQILNSDFETHEVANITQPDIWKVNLRTGYTWQLDSTIKHSGKTSLRISGIDKQAEKNYTPFSQICNIENEKIKKIILCVYIKTEEVSKNVGLWCQLWDSTNKKIGFYSLQSQNITIKGTSDWTKYSVGMMVNPEIKKLLLGGFLDGTGQVWFDDFSIEGATTLNLNSTSNEATKYIEDAINIVKSNSLYSDSINWNLVTSELKSISSGAQKTSDCYDAMDYLITILRNKGDNHSSFYRPEHTAKNMNENMDGRQPSGKYLGNSIGYIYVPGFLSSNFKIGNEFATNIQSIIKHIDSANTIKKWIVDLRENTGGNMYPMIAGLGPLMREGILGYFYSSKNKTQYYWSYKNGSSLVKNKEACKVNAPYSLKNTPKSIAVLIGPNTSSSGEMATISFIGQSNVVLIGQPTGGYTTGNAPHKLSDGSVLNIAGVFCLDRNQKKYDKKINPDILTEINLGETPIDKTLEFTIKKLTE